MGFPNHVDTATIFSHCLTARGDKPNSMLCSKNFFTWTHKPEFVNINWGGIKASTAPKFLWVKNPHYSRGRFSIVCLNLSTPGRRAFPEGDLSFDWFKDSHPFPPLPRRASTLMWKQRNIYSAEAGVQRGGRSFEAMVKGFYFYGLMRKKGFCVLPDFGSAGGHTEDYSKRQVLRKRERRVMVLFCTLTPHFLTRSHVCCRIVTSEPLGLKISK